MKKSLPALYVLEVGKESHSTDGVKIEIVGSFQDGLAGVRVGPKLAWVS